MASAFNPTELKYLLECGICLNRFQDPRVLPCLHSYCLECLKSHIATNKDKDGSFHCPQCREKCPMSAEGAEKFPKNFFVNAMKDVVPPSFIQESPSEVASGPIMCTYQTEENKDEHGPAVVFCGQCDAYFCRTCQKHHKMFGVTREHKVTQVDDAKPEQEIASPNCELHKNQQLNWYCETCSLPACPECLLEKHEGHAKEKLAVIEASIKQDMHDVSVLAAKRFEALQKISDDLKTKEGKMEEKLDQVNKNITDTADSLCRLVRQHEASLKAKIAQVTGEAKQHFNKASEELETLQKNVSSLMTSADTLYNAPPEQAVFTVLQGPISKQQALHQQATPIPSVQWTLKQTQADQWGETEHRVGAVDINVVVETTEELQTECLTLEKPLKTFILDYKGENAVCSIRPLRGSYICVAHYNEKNIWIYNVEGEMQRKIEVPGIDKIAGMVAVDNTKGKLAIVDSSQCMIYFVTVSEKMEIVHFLARNISRTPSNVQKNRKGELVLSAVDKKWVGIFNQNDQNISYIEVPIQHEEVALYSVCQTDDGFVLCDGKNKKVFFTDAEGNIVETCIGFSSPVSVTGTSFGHVLVADDQANEVKVFSERGRLLGKICDVNSSEIIQPDCLYIEETRRLLYITCGKVGEMELRVYKFTPGDIPPPPVTQNVTKLTMDIRLAKV